MTIQFDYVKGGGGSGEVNTDYTLNIYDALKAAGASVCEELSLFYKLYTETAVHDEVGCNCVGEQIPPGMIREASPPYDLIKKVAAKTDTAIFTVCRFSGENWDRKNDGTDDYFCLNENEKKTLEAAKEYFDHIIILLNVGAVTDVSYFSEDDKIEAALLIWQGGMEGASAAAEILFGDAYPSGKLTDTFAKSLDVYPSADTFAESEAYVRYSEDVFVGYRYFETIPHANDAVIYPFGYRLSYTSFKISDIEICASKSIIFVSVSVTNTGEHEGKEVVQVYCEPPAGIITIPKRSLCAFAKTPALMPGEITTLTMTISIDSLAVYDDTGAIQKSAYVLEAGEYKFHIGNSIRNTVMPDFSMKIDENRMVKQCTELCPPRTLDKRLNADGSYTAAVNTSRDRLSYECKTIPGSAPKQKMLLEDVFYNKLSADDFLAQLDTKALIRLLSGIESRGVANTGGMGGLEEYGIPPVMTADGPAGVRISTKIGIGTTAFPIATMLACTWNTELVSEIGRAGAKEMKENNLSIWLTPALNIHRNPLCGRNFEYYSEDPFVSGKMAAAMVLGIQSENIAACPKHFACNNKETNRFESDSVLSERALREIYLKGFEICVKEAAPKIIMTSYNLVNGIHTSENAELICGILRGEWGYRGLVTTDWQNTANHALEVCAGNDIKMPCTSPDAEAELEKLPRERLLECAKRLLELILWL